MPPTFRQLTPDELDAGYDVIVQAVAWLKTKGIRLWDEPLPMGVYKARHREGQNYALFMDDRPAVVLALTPLERERWPELNEADGMWLSTLATATVFRGQQLGRAAVEFACDHLWKQGTADLFLDCSADEREFLPRFYASLGFEQLVRKLVHYPGATYDVALMHRRLQ